MALTVHLNSFSYIKSGIPVDQTGHGGGFVFDCRFINNPGRKEEFRSLTGLNKDVILFLESQPEMNRFLENVYDITDPAIENYLDRGFTDLMISFGCTGGQHRSVFSAERLKKHISEKFPGVRINLHHLQIEKGLNIG